MGPLVGKSFLLFATIESVRVNATLSVRRSATIRRVVFELTVYKNDKANPVALGKSWICLC